MDAATTYPPGGYSSSTFGARELNFCVRYENRWILSAIATAMVIYPLPRAIYFFFSACGLAARSALSLSGRFSPSALINLSSQD